VVATIKVIDARLPTDTGEVIPVPPVTTILRDPDVLFRITLYFPILLAGCVAAKATVYVPVVVIL
jgi:hypothetical protein